MSDFIEEFKVAYDNLKDEYGFVCLGVAVIQDGEDSRTAFNFRWDGMDSKMSFTYSYGNDPYFWNDQVAFYDDDEVDVSFSAECFVAISYFICCLQDCREAGDGVMKDVREFLKKEAKA